MKAQRRFTGARLALWVAVSALAAFGAAGWGLALWDTSPPLAVMLAAVALVAPLVAAAMTVPAVRGGGLLAWACILTFTAMDAGSNANGFWQFEKQATAGYNEPLVASYEAEVAKATEARDTAQAALLALPTPSVDGPIKRLETYTATAAILTANLDTAKASLAEIEPPKLRTLLPREASGAIMALTSFALILGFLGVARAERREEELAAKAVPKRKPRAAAVQPPRAAEIKDFASLAARLRKAG